MELGRRAVGAMSLPAALLRAAAAAAASSTPPLLQGPMSLSHAATRYGVPLAHPRTGGNARITLRSAIGFLPGRSTSFLGGRPTGIRAFSTGRHNRVRWNEEQIRYYLFHMFEYFKSVIADNNAAAILHIERNRTELFAELHNSFQTAIWKWFGAVSAVLSATVSVSYLLYDKRCDMSENHFRTRMETQDSEIHLLRLQVDKLQNEPYAVDSSVYFVRADKIVESNFILIGDSPCQVNFIEENHSAGHKEVVVKWICRDISSGQSLEIHFPHSYILKVPVVSMEDYELLNTCPVGSSITVVSKNKMKKDIRVPVDLFAKVSELCSSKVSVSVTITSAGGREFVTDVKERKMEGRPHAFWRFFSA